MAAYTEDEAIAAAIAASIADNSALTTTEQLDHRFEARVDSGLLIQINLLNQFSSAFKLLIDIHQAPESICGYLSLAYAVIMARMAQRGEAFQNGDGDGDGVDLELLEPELRDIDAVLVEVDR